MLGYPICDYNGQGYGFGRCFVGTDWRLMYVPIEKNVTRVTQSMITTLGFEESDYIRCKKTLTPAVIVLRDPVQRWVSGVVEYLLRTHTGSSQNNMTRQNITPEVAAQQIVFDKHTCPQHRFIEQLQGPKHFVWFDENRKSDVIRTVSRLFTELGFENSWAPEQHPLSEISDHKRDLTQQFKALVQQDHIRNNIKDFYSKDYQLIDSSKFYS